MREVGYQFKSVAENICKGQTSPRQVVDSWMNSPDHCHSIMNDYQKIGIVYVGKTYYDGSHIWVQNFGTSCSF